MTLKRIAGIASQTKLCGHVLSQLEKLNFRSTSLRVLAFHRIGNPSSSSDYYPGLISTTPDRFCEQLDYLANQKNVVSMDQAIESIHGKVKLPERAVLLTFDDATLDFAEFAWPELQKRKLPATVFVPTSYPDNSNIHFWWDRLYRAIYRAPEGTVISLEADQHVLGAFNQRTSVFRYLKEHLKTLSHAEFQQAMESIVSACHIPDPDHNNVLSWSKLLELHKAGVTLAPHTQSHPMLNQMGAEEVAAEVTGSWQDLKSYLQYDVPKVLAYPAGGVTAETEQVLINCGYELAFTTRRGVNSLPVMNYLRLNRINVGQRTTLGLLRMQLL
ncbi:polysaccharide deacetylase family protein [Rubinisphaera italica]|uniref:Polysaccharide deacetylase n=1 Tax=Rubinisphaera italica TaxID=2527969 RepID=A0A5C5XGY9_9PLAN|nr:polysaccharide deacetylase family protein [Rubinisphaera italica]TWT61553.1 Polysaccharide deacetylase [Rubinisphaera italica]